MMKKSNFVIALLGLFLFISCSKSDDGGNSIPTDAVLYANFQNDGLTQILEIDKNKTAGPIRIENKASVEQAANARLDFIFSGVTFNDGKNVYEIENIVTQTLTDDLWSSDTENYLKQDFAKSLDIVLVLDVSASLDNNIDAVKASAIDMVKNILTNKPNSKVAVVKFSRGHMASNLSSSIESLTTFIQEKSSYTDTILGGGTYDLEGKSETALYEAMIKGAQILDNSNAKGKGLITFTDGKNNFQFSAINDNKDIVRNKLEASGINSYTIGFIGNANEIAAPILEELAVNGDFSIAKNLEEVRKVFKNFSNSISAVYDLTYNTNNATFTGKKQLRFLFDLKLLN